MFNSLAQCPSIPIIIETQEDIDNFSISNAIFMYSNPASDNLKLYVSNTIDFNSVSVYLMLGQKLTESNQKVVDFSNFASGVYFVEVVTNHGTLSKKVVKD